MKPKSLILLNLGGGTFLYLYVQRHEKEYEEDAVAVLRHDHLARELLPRKKV